MFRGVYLSAAGGLVVSVIILLAVMVLICLGVSFGEALYVSVSGLIVLSYAVTSWQLRRGK